MAHLAIEGGVLVAEAAQIKQRLNDGLLQGLLGLLQRKLVAVDAPRVVVPLRRLPPASVIRQSIISHAVKTDLKDPVWLARQPTPLLAKCCTCPPYAFRGSSSTFRCTQDCQSACKHLHSPCKANPRVCHGCFAIIEHT